jgi:transcriptional regulator with XRE-family HTH domain
MYMDAELLIRLQEADPSELGTRIRTLRLSRGLTQPQLAADKVSVPLISLIESGDRRPGVELLEHLADVLGVSTFSLITGIEQSQIDRWTLDLLGVEMALETGDAAEGLRLLAPLESAGSGPSIDISRRSRLLRARCLEVAGEFNDAIIELEALLATGPLGAWTLPPLIALSRCYLESGDFGRAIDAGEAGLARLAEAGIDGGDDAIRLTVTVAGAYFDRGDVDHAVRITREAMRQADLSGSPQAQAAAYWNASVFESERGALAPAIELARHALELLSQGEDRRNIARLRVELGLMLLRLDPPAAVDAQKALRRAKKELTASSASVVDLAACDIGLGQASLALGDVTAAREFATAAYDRAGDASPQMAAGAQAVLGRCAAHLWLELGAELEEVGDGETARDAYRRAAIASGLPIPSVVRKSTRQRT